MDGKAIALIAHIPLIGWLIAWFFNLEKSDEFASFYIRQQLGITFLLLALVMLPLIGWILAIGVFVFWGISLAAAAQNQKKETPYIGRYFQSWFKSM